MSYNLVDEKQVEKAVKGIINVYSVVGFILGAFSVATIWLIKAWLS